MDDEESRSEHTCVGSGGCIKCESIVTRYAEVVHLNTKRMRQAAISWTYYHFALAKTSSRLLPLSMRGEKKNWYQKNAKV